VRLFVAVWPDAAVLDELAALERPVLDGVRWTARDQWHITLRFFGEVDDAAPVEQALHEGVAQVPSTVAALGPSVRRVGAMLWAPVGGLDDLAAAVVDATALLGAPPERRPFRGHITLARQRHRGRGAPLRDAQGQALSGSWTVASIELVRSHLGRGGSQYETIARLPIAER
jgi:2'-5' RNA ligase